MLSPGRDAEKNAEIILRDAENKHISGSNCSFFYQAGQLPLASKFKTESVPSFQGRSLLKVAKLEEAQDDNRVIMAHVFEPKYLSI